MRTSGLTNPDIQNSLHHFNWKLIEHRFNNPVDLFLKLFLSSGDIAENDAQISIELIEIIVFKTFCTESRKDEILIHSLGYGP